MLKSKNIYISVWLILSISTIDSFYVELGWFYVISTSNETEIFSEEGLSVEQAEDSKPAW